MIPADLERPLAQRYFCPSPAGCDDNAPSDGPFNLGVPARRNTNRFWGGVVGCRGFSVLVATARFGAG